MSDMVSIKFGFSMDTAKKGFSLEQVENEGLSGCDAVVLFMITREGDDPMKGSKDIAMMSYDGYEEGKDVIGAELFQIFANLANHITSMPDVDVWQKAIASETFKQIKEEIDMRRETMKSNGKV